MGAGKAFGETIKSFHFDYNDLKKQVQDSGGIVTGSAVLSAKLKDDGLESFEPGDLDIFIKKDDPKISELEKYILSVGYMRMLSVKRKNYSELVGKDLFSVYEYVKTEEQKKTDKSDGDKPLSKKTVQIIILNKDPLLYVDSFDLDCCKYYWDTVNDCIAFRGNVPPKNPKHTQLIPECSKMCTIERANKYIGRGFKIYHKDTDISELINYAATRPSNRYIDLINYLKTKK